MTKEIMHYRDESMFKAQEQTSTGPTATLIMAPHDPLGLIAYTAKMYQGKQPEGLHKITDEDRRYYVQDVGKNLLGSPMETVQFTFAISGVTRAFTHQLVRQRVGAAYQQESMRFAVKDDFPVALPPSLAGTVSYAEWLAQEDLTTMGFEARAEYTERYASDAQKNRFDWDEAVEFSSDKYQRMINRGMPAEDARGLAPTNIMTNVNYSSTLRGLMDHAGMRLCTQAQFEWKQVWAAMIRAIHEYADGTVPNVNYVRPELEGEDVTTWQKYTVTGEDGYVVTSSDWQYQAISGLFKPVCFNTGKCEFMSDFDRYCPIREQVQAFHKAGVPPEKWGEDHLPEDPEGAPFPDFRSDEADNYQPQYLGIPKIRTEQWLNPNAAIAETGDWRSAEAQANIAGRR